MWWFLFKAINETFYDSPLDSSWHILCIYIGILWHKLFAEKKDKVEEKELENVRKFLDKSNDKHHIKNIRTSFIINHCGEIMDTPQCMVICVIILDWLDIHRSQPKRRLLLSCILTYWIKYVFGRLCVNVWKEYTHRWELQNSRSQSNFQRLSLAVCFVVRLVIGTLSSVDAGRRCYRLVGGVLVEKTAGGVLPTLSTNKEHVRSFLYHCIVTPMYVRL